MNKILRRALAVLLVVCLVGAGAFGLYVSDYYRAEPAALAIEGQKNGRFTLLEGGGTVGVVFYPGAKVQAESYLPLLDRLAQAGVTCVLAEMPCNLAFFGMDAAEEARAQYPQVERWYLMGHSLGGAMASSHMAANPGVYEGIILLGAYVYGEIPAQDALVLYGSEDLVLNREKLTGGENEQVIPGGNHAWFGNYGPQAGDGAASITPEQQQSITVQAVLDFMAE